MASFNRAIIIGNLGQDPELRHTQNQTAVCTLNLATTDYKTSADGQKQEFTEWHRVVVWGRQAENCGKYLAKGRSVMVEGRIQTRAWDDKQGQKRYTTEIVAQSVQFLGGGATRSQGQSQGQGQGGYSPEPAMNDNSGMDMDMNMGGPSTPGLDDIPF